MVSTPVMVQDFENQVFTNQNVKAIELSQTEMKETQGQVAPVVWALTVVTIRGLQVYQKGRKLSQAQAIAALKRGDSVITNSQKYSSQLANSAWGKQNVIQHAAHKPHNGFNPHYQHTSKHVKGHAFWQK